SVDKLNFKISDSYILPISTNKENDKYRFELVKKVEFRNDIGDIMQVAFVSPKNYTLFIRHNLVHNFSYQLETKIIDGEPNQPLKVTNDLPFMEVKVNGKPYISDEKGIINSQENLEEKEAITDFYSPSINLKIKHLKMDFEKVGKTYHIIDEELPIKRKAIIKDQTIKYSNDSLIDVILPTHYHSFFNIRNKFCAIDKDFNYLDKEYTISLFCYYGDKYHPLGTDYVNAASGLNNILFYNPLHQKIRLGQMPSVLYHELGHSINNFMYIDAGAVNGMQNATLQEGLADIHSAIMLGYPDVFRGASPNKEYDNERNLKNTLKLGIDNKTGVPHFNGQILSGALWDFAELTSMDKMAELMHFTRYALPDGVDDGTALTSWLKEMLITDDDDGNLKNGTPHFDEIVVAFDNHNINFDTYMQYNYVHTPLKNTLDTINSYETKLVIPFVNTFKPVEVWLHFSTSNGLVDSTKMERNESEYIGFIPAQTKSTIITYYFKVNSPFKNRYFKLDPYDKTHFFLVNFNLAYDDKNEHNGHSTSSANSINWQVGDPALLNKFTPKKTESGNPLCWLIYDFKDTNSKVRIEQADLYFPSVQINNKSTSVIELYFALYNSTVYDIKTPDLLIFMASNDNGNSWKEMKRIEKIDKNYDWTKVTFWLNDYFDEFDNIILRVRAAKQHKITEKKFCAAFIDDVKFWSSKNPIKSIATENEEDNEIIITPNPANSNCKIYVNQENKDEKLKIYISDINGNILKEFELASNELLLNTKELASGVYTVIVKSKEKTRSKKIVIER
ncbi:MAG: T9SS type A sorting domain-containing protein, partial [Ignavibacteria bacterium]|nr:T9SS type A sorting domain-containing protein [Ignavibacteria bacterium]